MSDNRLDTYDPNWKSALKIAKDTLNEFYHSDETPDGLIPHEELLNNPDIRERQAELTQKHRAAFLSQFETLENCVEFHENDLKNMQLSLCRNILRKETLDLQK